MSNAFVDQTARTRIVTDLNRSLLVEAGAGSGKTHEMAARMAAGVAAGVYDVSAMAAVTFTRKAAAELRGRFQQALETELAASVNDTERTQRVAGALASIERFFAGTIHSFCARLLRERPVEAGVSPGFSELDDVEERMLRRQAWRDYRAEASASGDPDRLRLDEAGIALRDLDDAFEIVSLHEDVDFPTSQVDPPPLDEAWRALQVFWREVEVRLPDPIADGTTCRTQQAAVTFGRDLGFHQAHSDLTASVLAGLLEQWEFEPKVTQNAWGRDGRSGKAVALHVKGLHGDFRETVVLPWIRKWRESLYAPCVRVLMRARTAVAAERRRRSKLTFNDLLLLTERLLRTNPAVRAALCRKYRFLFIDEFQDTDPLQAEIMRLLAGDEGLLFVVGDPKQSIYRFRRADIDSYNDMRATLAGPDRSGVVSLTTNFRSVPAICAWANGVFETRFPDEPTPRQPAFAPLVPRSPSSVEAAPRAGAQGWFDFETSPHGVRTMTVGGHVASKFVSQVCAEELARYIATEAAAGRRQFGDFLIITRKKRPLAAYAEALEALHVPVEVSGAGAFGESPHVADLAALLDALSDPQDPVALVGVLRGRLFGLSDPQLFAWRQAGGYIGLFSEPDEAVPDDAQAVGEALAALRRWYGWTRLLPPGAALERVLEESGYLALAACSPGGVEAGDLLHAVDRVRAAVENGFTLSEAAESLGDDAEESSEVESLPLEPGRGNVVRLMNLHKAKGLEAPVVILADPTGGFAPRVDVRIVRASEDSVDRRVDVGSESRLGPVGWLPIRKPWGPWGKKTLALPPDWDRHESVEHTYLEAEADRLLYVAATRARDLLVITRYAKPSSKAAWTAFDPFLKDVAELEIPPSAPTREFDDMDLSAEAAERAAGAIERAHEIVRQPSWAATSVTAEVKQIPRLSPVDPDDVAARDPTAVVIAETPSRRADAGLAWGALVHGLLEHAVSHPDAPRTDLQRLALWLTFEDPSLRSVIEQAIDTALMVVGSDRLHAARSSIERHAEAPFAVVITDDDGCPRVVTGAIDLVYRDGATWCVVDYKTDVDTAAMAGRYEAQVAAYADAWGRVTGEPVTTAIVTARDR